MEQHQTMNVDISALSDNDNLGEIETPSILVGKTTKGENAGTRHGVLMLRDDDGKLFADGYGYFDDDDQWVPRQYFSRATFVLALKNRGVIDLPIYGIDCGSEWPLGFISETLDLGIDPPPADEPAGEYNFTDVKGVSSSLANKLRDNCDIEQIVTLLEDGDDTVASMMLEGVPGIGEATAEKIMDYIRNTDVKNTSSGTDDGLTKSERIEQVANALRNGWSVEDVVSCVSNLTPEIVKAANGELSAPVKKERSSLVAKVMKAVV